MIDPSEVIEGRECAASVTCGGCKMIPARLRLSECSKCQTVICDKCYYLAKTEVEDASFDRENEDLEEDELLKCLNIIADCPSCMQPLDRNKRSKKETMPVMNSLKFRHKCCQVTAEPNQKLPNSNH